MLVLKWETEWFYQMQLYAGIGTQADNIARIGRNLGLIKNDVKHADTVWFMCWLQRVRTYLMDFWQGSGDHPIADFSSPLLT